MCSGRHGHVIANKKKLIEYELHLGDVHSSAVEESSISRLWNDVMAEE